MKVFAMLMLRCALIMLLSSLLQNGTLATLGESEKSCHKLKEWAAKCHKMVNTISFTRGSITLDYLSSIPETKNSLTDLLNEVNKFPLEGMDELLDRRLQKPLKMAISNCEKILNEIEHSGREDNKKYLESLVSKTSLIAMGIDKEFNTFMFEVQLELIKQVKWTSGNKNGLTNKFSNLCETAQQIESYCNPESFSRAFLWVSEIGGPPCQPGTPEFVEYLGILILNAKLDILKRELHAKIAGFVEHQHFDWNGFMEFSHNFKLEWNQIEQQIDQVNNSDIASTMASCFFNIKRLNSNRKKLDDLAKTAMDETAPLKAIITEKFDQLMTKCQNLLGKFNKEEASRQRVAAAKGMGPSKNVFKVRGSNKSNQKKQKEEAKKNEIDAMKEIINHIGMFDGAAYKLLVRFEHGELGKTDFCAELEKAVAEDKEMVSTAYQVKLRQMK